MLVGFDFIKLRDAIMDELGLPDIDPIIPTPEFFDTAITIPSADSDVALPTFPPLDLELPQAENILENFGSSEVKYDDESCEFNEFLLNPDVQVNSSSSDNSKTRKKVDAKGDDEDDAEGEFFLAEDAVTEIGGDNNSKKDEIDNTNSVSISQPLPDPASTSGSVKSCGSFPSTPDSKSESAVVRLSLPSIPKVLDPKRRISLAKDSPKKGKRENETPGSKNVSPPRQTRGMLNATKANSTQKGGTKRKLTDSEDEEHVSANEKTQAEESNTSITRSGRRSRKIPKYGSFDISTDDDTVVVGTSSGSGKTLRRTTRARKQSGTSGSGRPVRKVSRRKYKEQEDNENKATDSDSESVSLSDLFAPVKVYAHRQNRITTITTEANGVINFTNEYGETTAILPAHVKIKRLTEKDIQRALATIAEETIRNEVLLEVCVDNFESVQEAILGGAKRIELCSSLAEGGLTPSLGFLTLVKETFPDIPVNVMIRPRGGDFLYTQEELQIMIKDILEHKKRGADGFVFGVLTEDGEVHDQALSLLVEAANPASCTFHRAFDMVMTDPIDALETIIDLGFQRILTSGLAATAQQGIPTLKRLVEAANDRIIVLAGCGVNASNVSEIVRKTGVKEVHGSASKKVMSRMNSQISSSITTKRGRVNKRGSQNKKNSTTEVKMGQTDDSVIKVTDSTMVSQIVKNANSRK